jgi:hypothetical protein
MSRSTSDKNDAAGFERILNNVRRQAAELPDAVNGRCSQSHQHRAAFVESHSRVRGIAAILNRALGGWHSRNDQR